MSIHLPAGYPPDVPGSGSSGLLAQLCRKIGDIRDRNHDSKLVRHVPKLGRHRPVPGIVRQTQEGFDVIEKVFCRQRDASFHGFASLPFVKSGLADAETATQIQQ